MSFYSGAENIELRIVNCGTGSLTSCLEGLTDSHDFNKDILLQQDSCVDSRQV